MSTSSGCLDVAAHTCLDRSVPAGAATPVLKHADMPTVPAIGTPDWSSASAFPFEGFFASDLSLLDTHGIEPVPFSLEMLTQPRPLA